MAEINYPYLNQHKLMHKQITQSMVKLIQSIKSTKDLKEKLYIVVNSWLIKHIIQHDYDDRVLETKYANKKFFR
ncbi:hypothetical protein L8V92_01530 [Campylobacter lari]|nr:hypothetical protein [Campylobacter lari]MCV3421110.1 hypothetical protein [Campylobacter lari]